MSRLTDQIYQKYYHSLGPEQIASPKALRIIERYLEKFIQEISICARNDLKANFKKSCCTHIDKSQAFGGVAGRVCEGGAVVEIGSGIGTITELISTKIQNTLPETLLICYEVDDFCIEQLHKNVNFDFILFKQLEEIHSVNLQNRKTFLIIDDYISEKNTSFLLNQLCPRYVVIEGHRFRQRKAIVKSLIGKSISIRFFGNAIDSVKGACVITVWSESRNVLTYLAYWRLILQSSLLARRLLQAVGIRKKKLMGLFYRQ